ncbi:ExbD/TolR family protein [Aliamphritea hakodatensis]|uniref:ExbD/TolR family protein n=1 Tax=Aliamphritea hakodatensis TaxID=2895352 RepID=UPI0022FD9EF3|nr:biopolymer transporter ExbD [Aliamphritea hakodatensis]
MKTLKTPPQAAGIRLDQNMIPAINIVFLLLIFFMIAGQIEITTGQLVLPESRSEASPSQNVTEIHIDANGTYYLNRKAVSGTLHQALLREKIPPAQTLLLHAHSDLPAHVLDTVLQSVRELGIPKLQLATRWQP